MKRDQDLVNIRRRKVLERLDSSIMSDTSGNIKVVVRVRPLLPREPPLSECLVSMPTTNSRQTILKIPETSTFYQVSNGKDNNENLKNYSFDESIWSFNNDDENYTDNFKFYEKTSNQLLDHFFNGFNVCFLAYGQTGSGKTHTMMGSDEEPGMIPLLVKEILQRKENLIGERINCQLKILYMEIYNEQVIDLLAPRKIQQLQKCKVREHPVTGPYVENLVEYPINSFESFLQNLEKGNQVRSTASTSMNEQSSRSHAILTLSLIQTKFRQMDESLDSIGEAEEELISNFKLVDLAGLERLNKTKVFKQQDRLKEGTLINKSLTVLGRCINILSERDEGSSTFNSVVPYRDSVLTYILKENLAGNSKTFMLFCISPIDFEESYQTLNYANQVKRVKTIAKANKKKITGKRSFDWDVSFKDAVLTSDTNNLLITDLKNEVLKLSEELNVLKSTEQQSIVDQEKWNNLTSYLETQSNKVQFENSYLHNKLKHKSLEIEELKSQLLYMNNEVIYMLDDIEQESNNEIINKLSGDIIQRCQIGIESIETDLERFDPKFVF